jgi:lipoprotein-releasing system ATP-binding protein
MSEPAVQVRDLHKSYRLGGTDLEVLHGVRLSLPAGSFSAIVGASGSGKSTLLHLIGLLDKPDRGRILLSGRDTATMGGLARSAVRCREIGFVFQFYHLLPELNVLENVLLPARVAYSGLSWAVRRRAARREAAEILDRLGLSERLRHRPKELSGGERQRVAIARALINHPKVLLADEPTGNLDPALSAEIMQLFEEFNQVGVTVLIASHDLALISRLRHRIITLREGRLVAGSKA